MMESYWWIREIDWRISAGIIFSMQLIIWNFEERRSNWRIRAGLSTLILCMGSWIVRFILEEGTFPDVVAALGYSLYIMIMCGLFILCYYFIYDSKKETTLYISMVALTIYRMSWNVLKLISTIPVSEEASWSNGSIFQSTLSYLLYFGLSAGSYFLYKHFVRRPILFQMKMNGVFASILLCQMLLEFTFKLFYNGDDQVVFFLTAFLYSVINFVMLIMIAYLHMLRQENIGLESFIASKQKYYEISREGIQSLQIKCHDLKHQINMIRTADGEKQLNHYIDGLSDSIDEYNTVINTGNRDVDLVLTEKNIICTMNKIRFSYMFDGALFSFLSEMEIYSLFGNALDNAIESMSNVLSKEKAFVSMKASSLGKRVILVIENYYEHDLRYRDGIPITSKEEEGIHGFGLRSIQAIAKSHGGDVVIHAENNIFKLHVSMNSD